MHAYIDYYYLILFTADYLNKEGCLEITIFSMCSLAYAASSVVLKKHQSEDYENYDWFWGFYKKWVV